MKVETIRQRLSGPGPCLIRTSDGHSYLIPHTDFALIGRYNIVYEEENGAIEVIDPSHVVSVRTVPPMG